MLGLLEKPICDFLYYTATHNIKTTRPAPDSKALQR